MTGRLELSLGGLDLRHRGVDLDEQDIAFAIITDGIELQTKKYKIPVKVVINPPDYELKPEKMSRSYMGDGIMVDSQDFDGMSNIIDVFVVTLRKKIDKGFKNNLIKTVHGVGYII